MAVVSENQQSLIKILDVMSYELWFSPVGFQIDRNYSGLRNEIRRISHHGIRVI